MNNFAPTISKEELAALPHIEFGGRIVIVDTQEGVEAACAKLAKERTLGFDTETKPSFKAGQTNKVALLQLSTTDTCYLFRLSKISLDKSIIALLQNSDIVKTGVDVAGDLRALRALRHFTERGFCELQTYAAQCKISDKSLRKLAGITLGGRISKAQRLSNWEAIELTPAQQLYAATDAWVGLEIYKKLKNI